METTHFDFTAIAERASFHRAGILNPRTRMTLALMLADTLGLLLAALISVSTYELFVEMPAKEMYGWMLPMIAVILFVFYTRGLYPSIGLGAVEEFHRLMLTGGLYFFISGSTVLLLGPQSQFSWPMYILFGCLSLVLMPASRIVMRHVLTRLNVWGEPTIIIGRAGPAAKLAKFFISFPKNGLRPAVLVVTDGVRDAGSLELPVITERQIDRVRDQLKISTALVAYEELDEYSAIRETYRDRFERVVLINVREGGVELGGVSVRQYGNLLSFEIRHTLMDRGAQTLKRIIDLVGATVGLLLLSPLFAMLALLIKLDSPGGVFYRQQRVGKGGKNFGMLKFRTMHVNADEVLNSTLAQDPALKREWDTYQKLQNDPRITRMGRFLRRFSIDELPQLWNVLVGEMSIIGPRPIMINQKEMYGRKFAHYIRVVPGITGLWQISGRNHTSFARRTEFDVEYVNNWSVWQDVYILIRTVWVVLRRDGAC